MQQKGADMTISSSLHAGVAGLNANATRLATISDNIANSATLGYKRSTTDFHSLVIDGGSRGFSAGGVRTTTQRLVDERGPLISTSNPTDIAVSGRGLLPVTSALFLDQPPGRYPLSLMTTGSFRANADGYMANPNGMVLLGWPAESDGRIATYPRDTPQGLVPVRIDLNQFSGDPTTRLNLFANVPATRTMAGADGGPHELSIEYFGNLGTSETLGVTFTPTIPATGASNEWTLSIRDAASGGTVVGEYVLTFDDSREEGGLLSSVTTVSGGTYDPLTGSFDIAVAGGPLTVSIGRPGATGGMTQLSDTFAPLNLSRDGTPVGNLTLVEVDANGFLTAIYDNGLSRVLYQIPLADVPNPNGLIANSDQTFTISSDSGGMFLWDAGDGPTGAMVGYSREESATDVAAELTQLIQTQRAYSSNAKVIQTVDEMLQETTNIKR
jgi:flagellar hook protein FlgE